VTLHQPQEPSTAFIMLHLGGCALTWGCSFLFMKLLNGDVPLTVIAAIRGMGAALVLIAVVVVVGQSVVPKGREWRDWLVLATVNGWVPNILVAFALTQLDSGPAALIQASAPLMTAALAHLTLPGERITPQRAFGIAIGFIGILVLIGPKALEGGGSLVAVVAMLAMAAGYAIGNVYTRTIPNPAPLRLTLGQQLFSGIIATVLALVFAGKAGFAAALPHTPALAALAVISTAVPLWIFMRLIAAAGPTRASMTGYLVPIVAVLLGIIVLNEPVVLRQMMGGVIVLLGVAITTGLIRVPMRASS
jgi:drug/metabolite transporter (DMT)-like permease